MTQNVLEKSITSRVSQKEIARILGIGQASVSYALKGSSQVGDETKRKVMALCDKLNYRPNAHARSLRKSDSDLIGIVVSPLTNPYHALLTQYIGEELRREGFGLLVRFGFGSKETIKEQILQLLDQRAAGVIVTTFYGEIGEDILSIIHRSMPLVITGGSAIRGFDSVSASNYKGGRMVAEHLVSIGKKRFGIIAQPDMQTEGDNSRTGGFVSVLKEKGLRAPIFIDTASPGDFEAGYNIGREIIEEKLDIDGLFAFSDSYAIGVVAAFRDMGISVPEEIAVVGYDDIPGSKFAVTPLTTIRLPIRQYALETVKMLTAQIRCENIGHSNIELDQELIIRASTDKQWSFDKES